MNIREAMLKSFLRNKDDGGGAGDPGAGVDPGQSPGGGEVDDGSGGDRGGAGDGVPDARQLLDLAKPGEGEGDPGEGWKAPDSVPEHMRGKSAEETIEKLNTAYLNARRAISNKGEGKPQADQGDRKPEDYAIAPIGEDDRVAQALSRADSAPIFDAFVAAAIENGIEPEAYQAMIRAGFEASDAAGVPLLATEDEAREITADAEAEELQRMCGGSNEAAQTVLNTVAAFRENLLSRQLIDDDGAKTFNEMCGTAEAAMLMHKILVEKLGEKPVAISPQAQGGMTPQAAQDRYAEALAMPPGPNRDAALRDAMKGLEEAMPG